MSVELGGPGGYGDPTQDPLHVWGVGKRKCFVAQGAKTPAAGPVP